MRKPLKLLAMIQVKEPTRLLNHGCYIPKPPTTEEARRYVLQCYEKQAQNINANTLVCVVEDKYIKRVGNLMSPRCLWIDFELGVDNLDVIRGLPKVIIFPKSEESAKKWKSLNVAKVGSIIRSPNDIVLNSTY